jgi:hypothetical protein
MIARALTAAVLCLVVAGASAQQDKRTAVADAVKAIAELGYTGAAAVRCKLRPEDWNEDLSTNATEALAAISRRNSSEADQGRQFYLALTQLWTRAEAAKAVVPADCAASRDSTALKAADAIATGGFARK